MTRQELQDLIKATVSPLVAEAVGERMAKAGESPSWVPQLIEGLQGGREPQPEPTLAKGEGMALMLRALAGGKGDPERAAAFAKKAGMPDQVVKALAATDPTSGGFLVPEQFATDYIELLYPASAVRALRATVIQVPTGVLRIPKLTSGASATYIAENSNITKSEPRFGQITLAFKKLAALVPISNDLLRFSSPGANTVVRDDVVRAMAKKEDLTFLRSDGSNGEPKGILNWANAANKFAAGTTSLANATADLGKCIQLLMEADVPITRGGWVFTPRTWKYLSTVQTTTGMYAFRDEMMRGMLWGYPFRVTSQGTNTEVYFVDFADVVIGESTALRVDVSAEAAYHDGSAVVAAFSQDQTVVRVIAEHDLALRHDKAAAVITGVAWGA